MKRPSGAVVTGLFILVILMVGLLISLVVLIKPTQAGQAVLRSSVDVAATARAIQFRNRQAELEATGQAQQANWEALLAGSRQNLAEFEQNGQGQVTQLESELAQLQSQLDRLTAELQTTQAQIQQVQQAIEADQADYQDRLTALDQEMSQIELELQNRLSEEKAALQAAAPAPETVTPPAAAVQGSDGGSAGQVDDGHSSDDHSSDRSDDGHDKDKSDGDSSQGED